ncbi:MAG: hypothetical protein KKB24_02510 [Candidatus Altiarchaeota archaeon]|nr:hypothetical protein [Candidatus Altiarchaeota archaeon]MBU4406438.1 hypothetical protein [Candidatus Altiarchaeota archaeon]MBU4437091.1 hypothetical protein [Candidatus Altiarchaeota archaeon]
MWIAGCLTSVDNSATKSRGIRPSLAGESVPAELNELYAVLHKYGGILIVKCGGIRAIRSRFYDKKDFDMIMKYCSEEFNFELMRGEFYLRVADNLQ